MSKDVDVRLVSFAGSVARTMKDLSSSHVYFILQQALGEDLTWEEAVEILDDIIAITQGKKT